MKKYVYFWVFAIIAVIFCKSPIFNYAARHEVTSSRTSFEPEISYDEMNSFLRLWPKYLQSNVVQLAVYQVSLADGKPSKVLHPKVVRWLEHRGWNADRFFYVQQRLVSIVQTLDHEELIGGMIKTWQQQLETENNQSAAQNLRQSIDAQVQTLNVERISEDELNMAAPFREDIRNILEGKAAYEFSLF